MLGVTLCSYSINALEICDATTLAQSRRKEIQNHALRTTNPPVQIYVYIINC
jgi:hypothetical protein